MIVLKVPLGDMEEWIEHRWDQKGHLTRPDWRWTANILHGFLSLQGR